MTTKELIEKFNTLLTSQLEHTDVQIPTACCLSTTGLDGYPNARFLALKGTDDDSFHITGPLDTKKAQEIDSSNKIALTFWWPEIGTQIRIQGQTELLSDKLVEKYFYERPVDSQLTALVFSQGQELVDEQQLESELANAKERYQNKKVPRPDNWGGYRVIPIRIEFLQFAESRIHQRELFTFEDGTWINTKLQP